LLPKYGTLQPKQNGFPIFNPINGQHHTKRSTYMEAPAEIITTCFPILITIMSPYMILYLIRLYSVRCKESRAGSQPNQLKRVEINIYTIMEPIGLTDARKIFSNIASICFDNLFVENIDALVYIDLE
jgi:hypothetical protein